MTVRSTIALIALTAVVLLPSVASAAPAATPAPATAAPAKAPKASKPATLGYDLDWTLPTAGKSGCNVCHGDSGLVRIRQGRTVSLFVDTAILQESAHKNVPCTGCHVDFAYKTPHDAVVKTGQEWRAVAKLACKNCHKDAFTLFSNGAHSPAGKPGETSSTIGAPDSSAPGKTRPLCGDCHGGHAIPSREDTAANSAVRASALTMCGTCHVATSAGYADYYHGAAYRQGAKDAPACWQCHETHQTLPADDRRSAVNKNNLTETCGTCHDGADEGYVEYAKLIHRAQEVRAANPLQSVVDSARSAMQTVLGSIRSLFAGREVQALGSAIASDGEKG